MIPSSNGLFQGELFNVQNVQVCFHLLHPFLPNLITPLAVTLPPPILRIHHLPASLVDWLHCKAQQHLQALYASQTQMYDIYTSVILSMNLMIFNFTRLPTTMCRGRESTWAICYHAGWCAKNMQIWTWAYLAGLQSGCSSHAPLSTAETFLSVLSQPSITIDDWVSGTTLWGGSGFSAFLSFHKSGEVLLTECLNNRTGKLTRAAVEPMCIDAGSSSTQSHICRLLSLTCGS